MKKYLQIGYSFFDNKVFTESELKSMAAQCGDLNFVHHDSSQASKTRFSGVIASGSAISAIFSAMIPTHFSQFSPMLGLEMSFKFLAPIKPDIEILMRWSVVKIIDKSETEKILELEGEITNSSANVLVSSKAKIILLPQL